MVEIEVNYNGTSNPSGRRNFIKDLIEDLAQILKIQELLNNRASYEEIVDKLPRGSHWVILVNNDADVDADVVAFATYPRSVACLWTDINCYCLIVRRDVK